jgi:hypothetical protein
MKTFISSLILLLASTAFAAGAPPDPIEQGLKDMTRASFKTGLPERLHQGDCKKENLSDKPYQFESKTIPQAFQIKLDSGEVINGVPFGGMTPSSDDFFKSALAFITKKGSTLQITKGFFVQNGNSLEWWAAAANGNEPGRRLGKIKGIFAMPDNSVYSQGASKNQFCDFLKTIWPEAIWPKIGGDGGGIGSRGNETPEKNSSGFFSK